MDSRAPTALLVGVLAGALLVATLAGLPLGEAALGFPDSSGSSTPDPSPGFSLSKASGCYDGPRENAGWVHVVASGRTYAVTLNATVVHDAGTVDADVVRRPTGEYEIALTTTAATERRKGYSREGCLVATELGLGTGLPYPEFVVTLDGREILSVDQEETVANLYPLSEPVNATVDA